MIKIKLFAMALVLASMLALGNPGMTRAANVLEIPPAIVFVQDKDNRMLVKHNFKYDEGMLIPGDMDVDEGFFVSSPESK